MSPKLRFIRIPLLGLLAGLALVGITASSAAAATRACDPPSRLPDGSGYNRELRATNISCSYAVKTFIKSYWRCRTDSGDRPTGRCRSVRGFTCTDKRLLENKVNGVLFDFDARATCRRDDQKIVLNYQQVVRE